MKIKDYIMTEEGYDLSLEEFISILTPALMLRGNTNEPCFCCGLQSWRHILAIETLLVYSNQNGIQSPFIFKGHWGCWFEQSLKKFYGIKDTEKSVLIRLHKNIIQWRFVEQIKWNKLH